MNIPKFWARGSGSIDADNSRSDVECCRWSDVSQEDAQQRADARAKELAGRLRDGTPFDHYSYADRPIREQVIHALSDQAEDTVVVTRNQFGTLVLNAAKVMFIDVDFPYRTPSLLEAILSLFGKKTSYNDEEVYLQRIEEWANAHAGYGVRAYRTAAGIRCVITSHTFEPTSADTQALLKSIGSDPLYVRLCKSQACFRARLTPKPWRCGCKPPPFSFPFLDASQEAAFNTWLNEYDTACREYSVCRLLKHFGPTDVHPDVQVIVDLHDRFACSDSNLPLA